MFFHLANELTTDTGALGANWQHPYERHLEQDGDNLTAYRPDGKRYPFQPNQDSYQSDLDVNDQLSNWLDDQGAQQGWLYQQANGLTEWYDLSGRLLKLRNHLYYTNQPVLKQVFLQAI